METERHSLTAPTQNLHRLVIIRTLLLVTLLVALALGYWTLQLPLPYLTLLWILIGLAAVNAFTWLRLRYPWPVTHMEFFSQLLIDGLSITLLLYFCGGASNPFVSYYLVPLCIAAATLPLRFTLSLSLVSLSFYTLLLFFYVPIADLAPHDHHTSAPGQHQGLNLHILGMWFNFLVSAALITYFVVQMAQALRQREAQLNQQRDEDLRNEQMMAVATLAAGTAHELGTPLSTMKVLLTEIQNDCQGNSLLQQDLKLLQGQVAQCADILKKLSIQAELDFDHDSPPQDVKSFCEQLTDRWQVTRPEAEIQLSINPSSPAVKARFPHTVEQSIINLLNNAADANPKSIEVSWRWTATILFLRIRDHGPGIPVHLAEQLGQAFITTKGQGLGLGLFLSHATVSKFGGRVALYDEPEGGTRSELELPLKTIEIIEKAETIDSSDVGHSAKTL